MYKTKHYKTKNYDPQSDNRKKYSLQIRRINLKKYGINLGDYSRIFKLQKGCCAICGKPQSYFKNKFAVDHNHKTGKIRGLLCMHCNINLEWIETHKKKIQRYLKDIKNIRKIQKIVKNRTLFG